MRWNINMYRLSLENQPHMPAIEGVLHQRDEDPEELSLICTTFGSISRRLFPTVAAITLWHVTEQLELKHFIGALTV